MPHSPTYIAYAPGGPGQFPIGAAFARPDEPGFTLILDALPLNFDGRVALLARRPPPCAARFFPAAMPASLHRPVFRAERRIWQALRNAPLPPGTLVFCNRAPRGCRRRADFLILWPQRGLIAIEVKGGRLAFSDGLQQPLPGRRWAKRIEPWLQSRRALAAALAALDLNPLAIPHAPILAMPDTGAATLPFPSAPHMLTTEELEPRCLARKLEALLPRLDAAAAAAIEPALKSLANALTRSGDRSRP